MKAAVLRAASEPLVIEEVMLGDAGPHEVHVANTGRLISVEDGYDPVTGLPRMGAIPVRVIVHQSVA